jgi:hypothetical protein
MDPATGGKWNDADQARAHEKYASKIQPKLCYEMVTDNALLWERGAEYVPGINPNAAYLKADLSSDVKRQLGNLLKDSVLRIRMRLPVTPVTPCAGCSLSGSEQLRYWSMSFMNGGKTIVSLSDEAVVKDANGYATFVISVGGKQPVNATPANGYTYINISAFAGAQLESINIRSMLPASGFLCQPGVIPFLTTEDNPLGGFMGEYAPTADLVSGASLPGYAAPFVQPNACGVAPVTPPQNCSAFYPSSPLLLLGQ